MKALADNLQQRATYRQGDTGVKIEGGSGFFKLGKLSAVISKSVALAIDVKCEFSGEKARFVAVV